MHNVFEDELKKIDAVMPTTLSSDIPHLLRNVPLDIFGKLLLDIPAEYPNIKKFFPSMASADVQKHWTNTHGEALLNQSLIFVKAMIFGYAAITGKKIRNASVLDFGCGWGRLIRLLYKYMPVENIYGVDPLKESIEECTKHNIKCNLAISDWVPTSLPFERKFDLIYAFSVFTHLSEKTAQTVMKTLRTYIADDGLLVITIRPREHWNFQAQGTLAPEMMKIHDEKGFAFVPHKNRAALNGDVTYGDTSISLAYVENNFPGWKLESVEWNSVDINQIILFLSPA